MPGVRAAHMVTTVQIVAITSAATITLRLASGSVTRVVITSIVIHSHPRIRKTKTTRRSVSLTDGTPVAAESPVSMVTG